MSNREKEISVLHTIFSEIDVLFSEMYEKEARKRYESFFDSYSELKNYVQSSGYQQAIESVSKDVFDLHYEKVNNFINLLLTKLGMKENVFINTNFNTEYITQQTLSNVYEWLPHLNSSQMVTSNKMKESGCAVAALLNIAKKCKPESSFFSLARKAVIHGNFHTNGNVDWVNFLSSLDIDMNFYSKPHGTLPSTFSFEDLKKVLRTEGAYIIVNVPYKEIGRYGHFITLLDIEEYEDTANYICMPSSNNDTNEDNVRYTGEVDWTLLPQNRVSIPASTLGTIEQFREHLRVFIPTETTLENILANTLETIEITPTDVIELGAWEYLGNGIFRVKSGAMSWELTQYLVDGKTFGNAQYIMKRVMQTEEGMLLFEARGNKDFGNINPGEIVVFDENDVSMQNIANALEEVQVQTDETVNISEQNTQEVVANAEPTIETKFTEMMQNSYGMTADESVLIEKAYNLLSQEADEKGLLGQEKIHHIFSNMSSLCTNYNGDAIRWSASGDIPKTDDTLKHLERLGMDKSEVLMLYTSINQQHRNPADKDFAHELVQYAIFSDDSIPHSFLDGFIGNMNALGSYKGDVYSARMGIDDMNSDVDANNIYNRMINSDKEPIDIMYEYNQDVLNNEINRVDEFLSFYGNGDIDAGLEYIEQDLYNTDMGSHYIGGQYDGTIGFIKEVLQDALFMDAMVSSGVALQGQDTFDAVMSNTNQNSVISDSPEIQETIKEFIKYLEEGRSK